MSALRGAAFGLLLGAALAGCSLEFPTATVGGANVPTTLHCEEDEVVGFVGIDQLGCIHIDELTG